MQDKSNNIFYDSEYNNLILFPTYKLVDPKLVPKKTILLRIDKEGVIAFIIVEGFFRQKIVLNLTQEEITALGFPSNPEPKIFHRENNEKLVSKIKEMCGYSCHFENYLDVSKRKLNLWDKHLRSEVVPHLLKFLDQHKEIEELDISKNSICDFDSDRKVIEMLAANNSLKVLKAFDIDLGDKGADYFKRNKSLTTLDVRYNNITLKGLLAIADNGNITKLDISHNSFRQAEIEQVLNEPDPLKRANYGRRNKVLTEVPTLLKLCLFAYKKQIKKGEHIDDEIKFSGLPDLTKKINNHRI